MTKLTPADDEIGLSDKQIKSFWIDGFLVIDDVFPNEDVEQLREATATPEVLRDWRKQDVETRTVHLLEITVKHPLMMELARSPRILQRVTPLIGPDIQLQHSKLATKPVTRGTGVFHWHQDFAFFPHTNSDLLAVMVMLDDATPENGCMQMVRGSHKLGLLDHDEDGLFHGNCQESYLWEDPGRIANITPKAGGISIHHALTLHGSPANISGAPRRGVVFQYRADDAYQLAQSAWADTGLLMCGQRRERARCDAGVLRLPKSHFFPGYPFGDAWNQDGELARKRGSVSISVEIQMSRYGLSTRATVAIKPDFEWNAPLGRKSRLNIRLTRSKRLVVRKAERGHLGYRCSTRKKAMVSCQSRCRVATKSG